MTINHNNNWTQSFLIWRPGCGCALVWMGNVQKTSIVSGKRSGVVVPRRMKRCTPSCWRLPKNFNLLPTVSWLRWEDWVQWMENDTCKRGFSTLTKTDQWYTFGDFLLVDLMMIDLNGTDIESVDEVKTLILSDFLEELILSDFLESVNEWKDYKKRIPSKSTTGVTRLRQVW